MSIEKRIHRKASDYVSALQDPDAPELEQPKKANARQRVNESSVRKWITTKKAEL